MREPYRSFAVLDCTAIVSVISIHRAVGTSYSPRDSTKSTMALSDEPRNCPHQLLSRFQANERAYPDDIIADKSLEVRHAASGFSWGLSRVVLGGRKKRTREISTKKTEVSFAVEIQARDTVLARNKRSLTHLT